MKLPVDLLEFISAGKQLEYDPDTCEAGMVKIRSFANLKYERFPVETSSSKSFKQDPNYPNVNSYLVLGVNLVESCTNDYDPAGILIWLPIEKRYGVWDASHCTIIMFGIDITWKNIIATPSDYINAGWFSTEDPELLEVFELLPWLNNHPYSNNQLYDPQPA
ncbi:MAG: hypothetical protein KME17_18335 [Cyanosarcina radialis HA8281-LM2]|jgi:hypothetical protein|nr:hypothetical protein [Cyanosarcina radialis HA8281-LM2]